MPVSDRQDTADCDGADAGKTGVRSTSRAPRLEQTNRADSTTLFHMFQNRKSSMPTLFLKFGVDDHGFVVPLLRRIKGQSVQLNGALKIASLQPKPLVRAR